MWYVPVYEPNKYEVFLIYIKNGHLVLLLNQWKDLTLYLLRITIAFLWSNKPYKFELYNLKGDNITCLTSKC